MTQKRGAHSTHFYCAFETVPDMVAIPGYITQVFHARDFAAVSGANSGDALSAPDTLSPGDIYQLAGNAEPLSLMVQRDSDTSRIAPGSAIGADGDTVQVLGEMTLMATDGDQIGVALINVAGALFAMPLTPLRRAMEYTLIRCAPAQDSLRLVDLACASFVKGTMITRADGALAPIETLVPGDVILTRDHGPQPLRWIGRTTLRAHGSFAPVVIGAGVLGNHGALSVSQHHRMFLYQRGSARMAPRAEVLLQARYLVDGVRVSLRTGGFVDYVSLVFDQHEIIYAEGIPVESLLVSEATVARLPDALAADLLRHAPDLQQSQHIGLEPDTISPALLAQLFLARGRGT